MMETSSLVNKSWYWLFLLCISTACLGTSRVLHEYQVYSLFASNTCSECKYRFLATSDTRVFVGGYIYKAYIRTIRTLRWAPYIKFIIGCILPYIIEYYALQLCVLLLYVANIVYLRPTEMVEVQILARYSQISSIYSGSSAKLVGRVEALK